MVHRSLVGPAAMFGAATVWGALVSLRDDVAGEPLGLRARGPVWTQLAAGLGSGLSAPWPMPAAVAVAVLRGRTGDALPARTCVVVGGMLLAGVLVEPVTWGRRRRSRAVASTVVLNLASAVALQVSGYLATRDRPRPGGHPAHRA